MSAEYSVKEVLKMASWHRKNSAPETSKMLTAFARRIEADESAVPVVWVDPDDVAEEHHSILATANKWEHQGSRYTLGLFTHPSAQVGADGGIGIDCVSHGPAQVVVTKNEASQIVTVTRQDADGRIVEVIAESAQVDADWRIGMFDRWRAAAQEKGYAGIAEAITAAPAADPVTQGEAVLPKPIGTQLELIAHCPFCGSEADLRSAPNDYATSGGEVGMPHVDSFFVHCDGCGCDGPVGESDPNARDLWNDRAAQPRAVPYGWALVPSRFLIEKDAWEAAQFAFGGPGTGEGEEFMDCTAWVGEIENDDGSKTHGMHVQCNECPEEGSITIAEFAAAPQPGESA